MIKLRVGSLCYRKIKFCSTKSVVCQKNYLNKIFTEKNAFFVTQNTELEKVHSVENAHKNPKEVSSWIQTIDGHQNKKSAPTVIYSKKMPEIDTLLEPWDHDFERVINEIPMPADDLGHIPMELLVKFSCGMLDIPVHNGSDNNLIESLHLMFTMYSGLRENQHFQQNQEDQPQVNRLQL